MSTRPASRRQRERSETPRSPPRFSASSAAACPSQCFAAATTWSRHSASNGSEPRLARTLVLLVLTGILVFNSWLRIEQTEPHRREAALLVALGFLPALAFALAQ